MQLRSFIFCCAFGFCFVGLVQADELKQLQTRLQSGQADVAEILKDVNVYLQRSPNDFQALFLKARILERTGNIVDAKQILQELIKARPESVAAYNNLARLYLAEGDLVQAQLLLEQAMRTHTGYATVYENLNQVYAARAKESYGKALQLKSSQPQLKLVELDAGSQPLTKPKKQIQLADNSNIKKQQTDASKPEENHPITAPVSEPEPVKQNIVITKNKPRQKKPAINQAALDRNEIISTLEGWAAAWSEQAADVYFIFYADDYHPPGLSRSAWKQQRRKRLKKPSWIKIALKGINVKSLSSKEARVELIQDYRASNYQDKTKKEIRLRQTGEGWRIVAERNINRIN